MAVPPHPYENQNGKPKVPYYEVKTWPGRRLFPWVEAVQGDLREEFDRLRKLGVKLNLITQRSLALHVLWTSETTAYRCNIFDTRT